MGSGTSKGSKANNAEKKKSSEETKSNARTTKKSQAVSDRTSVNDMKPTDLPEANRWHKDQKFEDENSLIYSANDDYAELRNMLAEPLGQRFLGEFAKAESSHENFFAWIEMEEFKQIPTPDFRRCQARQIFKKYIRNGAPMQLGGLTEQMIKQYDSKIYHNSDNLSERTFSQLQHLVFREMSSNTFARFKASSKYDEYKKKRKELYNRLSVEDFNYFEYLGGGAFGKVVRVVKKSTNREYAMKVVSKAKMLEQLNSKNSKVKYERINIERNVFVNSSFPFIIDMDYAFQTETEVMLVMEYARCGTLRDLVHMYDNKRMPEDHARYAICQVMLALRHLHYMNYVYRDLKPINVLINHRGIIKLGDMGLVARIDDTIKPIKDKKVALHKAKSRLDAGHPDGYDERPIGRRYSIVGTSGYKAPEMLRAKKKEGNGYGASVDWWSLGVMSFELLAGINPYSPKIKNLLVDGHGEKCEIDAILAVKRASDELPNAVANNISDPCKAFLNDLLQVDPANRLGTTSKGVQGIRSHPFFECYDFEKMLNLEIEPPYQAKKKKQRKDPQWKKFRLMMDELETADIGALLGSNTDNTVKDRHQRYFKNWDYVSQATFKLEFNIQQRKTIHAISENAPKGQEKRKSEEDSNCSTIDEANEGPSAKKDETSIEVGQHGGESEEMEAPVDEAKEEEAVDAPVEEAKEEEAVGATVDEAKEEEAVGATVDEAKEEEAVDAPVDEAKEEETVEAPVDEAKEEEATETPVEETKEEDAVDAPVDEAKEEEAIETPVEETKEEDAVDAPVDEAKEEEAIETPVEESKQQDTHPNQQQVTTKIEETLNDVKSENEKEDRDDSTDEVKSPNETVAAKDEESPVAPDECEI